MSEAALAPVGEGASNIGMDVGETITVEQALYGIMVGSANEVANAVAEKVSGSIDAFVDLMNERAVELGCTNTHFVTTNGLHDDNHYTTAHDLCLIAKAFFENDTLARIGNTPSYHFTATATQPDDFYLTNKHQLITGETPCDGVLGGKTGYTSLARETLVTAAERNGMTLICAVLKEESPYQFTDTVNLFDYGFNNFFCTDVAGNDSSVNFYDKPFLSNGKSPFGNNTETFSLAETGTVIVPTGYSISDLTSNIEYASDNSGNGTVTYSYGNTVVGTADLTLTKNGAPVSADDSGTTTEEDNKKTPFLTIVKDKVRAFYHRFIKTNDTGTIFIDIRSLLIFISLFFVCLSCVIMIIY
jgi:D-alanyl-D-alanine carboxypeptidase